MQLLPPFLLLLLKVQLEPTNAVPVNLLINKVTY